MVPAVKTSGAFYKGHFVLPIVIFIHMYMHNHVGQAHNPFNNRSYKSVFLAFAVATIREEHYRRHLPLSSSPHPPSHHIHFYVDQPTDTMKITKTLLLLLLSVIALTVSQEEAVDAVEPEPTEPEPVEEAIEVNCDEICASLVAEATRVVNEQLEMLKNELTPLQAALAQAKESSVAAASEVTTLKGQLASMDRSLVAAKAEVEAITVSTAEKEAIANAKLAEMMDQTAAANARVAEFENLRFFINKDKIMSDLFAMFRKIGALKPKEAATDL